MTFDTVFGDTPASLATSLTVARMRPFSQVNRKLRRPVEGLRPSARRQSAGRVGQSLHRRFNETIEGMPDSTLTEISDHTTADSHDVIQVRGARENNLSGVSRSGKSSLVFDTIAAESQRLINETYTAFVQAFMPSLSRPDVDSLRNLSAAIIVDQERIGANARSTVGTATDAHTMLRILFSRIGTPYVGPPSVFSFNRAEGMCPV